MFVNLSLTVQPRFASQFIATTFLSLRRGNRARPQTTRDRPAQRKELYSLIACGFLPPTGAGFCEFSHIAPEQAQKLLGKETHGLKRKEKKFDVDNDKDVGIGAMEDCEKGEKASEWLGTEGSYHRLFIATTRDLVRATFEAISTECSGIEPHMKIRIINLSVDAIYFRRYCRGC